MSYGSENKLPINTPINRLFEIIELLGYIRVKPAFKIDNLIRDYMWSGDDTNISFVGVELSVFKYNDYISVTTRTREGRSPWDLQHQNKTISLLKSIFHGSFSTDEGKNKYFKTINTDFSTQLESSIFIARWIFNNAINKAKIYLDNRNLQGQISSEKSTGFSWLDEYNPRIISNNMIIPYLIGCWESFFRNTYVAILKYSDEVGPNALKSIKISNEDLLSVIRKNESLENIVAENLSFQHPKKIHERFKQLNNDIDICGCLSKPYHNRKTTLLSSISSVVETRHLIVHTAHTDIKIFDREINIIINDLTEAINRAYEEVGEKLGFKPNYNF